MTELPTVKCQDCGLLAVVNYDGTSRECPQEWRDGGERPPWLAREGCSHSPACHAGAFRLGHEYESADPPHDQATKAVTEKGRKYLHVITAPRVCPKFTPYRLQLTPEQHVEQAERTAERSADAAWEREKMDIHREIELMRMNWQADQAIKQRHWQEDFAAKQAEEKRKDDESHRKWQEEQDKKRGRIELIRWVIAGVGGIVVMISAFYGGRHYAEQDRIAAEQRAAQKTAKTE